MAEYIVSVHGKYDDSKDGSLCKSWFNDTNGKIRVRVGDYAGPLLERYVTGEFWDEYDPTIERICIQNIRKFTVSKYRLISMIVAQLTFLDSTVL